MSKFEYEIDRVIEAFYFEDGVLSIKGFQKTCEENQNTGCLKTAVNKTESEVSDVSN